VRLVRSFVAHEARTQARSLRFRLFSIVYVLVSALPALVTALVSWRSGWFAGGAAFARALDILQPFMTSIFAGGLAVDALTRERDENSFPVLSLAPVSSAGYVLRRWLALNAISLPVTLVPSLIAGGLAANAQSAMPDLAPIAWTWLLHVAPVFIVISALVLGIGTITGRTLLTVIALVALLTLGLGALQSVLALGHRQLGAPGDLFGFNDDDIEQLKWTLRGYWRPTFPSEAGYPLIAAFDRFVPSMLLTAGVAALMLGLAPAFLRRTRRDLRPWRVAEGHPLRTFIRTINRVRQEYSPDAGRQAGDVLAMLAGILIFGAALAALLQRETRFIRLAAERYAAETRRDPREMSADVAPLALRIEGEIGRSVHTRATFVLQNTGAVPRQHLAFALHPGLALRTVRASAGTARVSRIWERIGIELVPPIDPGATRTLTFEIDGKPDGIEFALRGNGPFRDLYRRYLRATQAVELSDLSRSHIVPAATHERMLLSAGAFVPVPRYTAWSLNDSGGKTTSFATEGIRPATDLTIALRVPRGFTVADSCGTIGARGRIESRCRLAVASYGIAGGRMHSMPAGPVAIVLYLPAHEELARTHAPALASALALATRGWPGLELPRKTIFFERPTDNESLFRGESSGLQSIESSGAMLLLPEPLVVRREPIEAGRLAAALVASSLSGRRRIVPREQLFFSEFFAEAARGRLSGEARTAAVSSMQRPPTGPLLEDAERGRLRAVLADLEYRVGGERIIEGVNDFLAMPGAGTGRQLLDSIGRRSGVSLDNVYRDFFVGRALPRLTIEAVVVRREGSRWSVSGVLRNVGTGEVFAPLVLRTRSGSLRRVVRIGSGEAVPFSLPSESEPRTLQLDPDHVCYRQPTVGLVDSVELKGES
jgi:ABC-type transport system involved in multi-copper enzyme maturation permease subunit